MSKNILIVGDWFVDEYWFMVRHHSDVSSHTGPVHYRIASQPDHFVRDLCGCGLIARVFYELRKYKINNWSEKVIEIINKNHEKVDVYYKNQFEDGKLKDGSLKNGWLSLDDRHRINNLINKAKEEDKELEVIEEIEEDSLSEKVKKDIEDIKNIEDIKTNIKAIIDDEDSISAHQIIGKKEYSIYGIGLWNPNDNNYIPHLIHAHCHNEEKGVTIGRARFSLKPVLCKKRVDVTLHNLEKRSEGTDHGTTLVIRAYRYVKKTFEPLHRIDWELAPKIEHGRTSPPPDYDFFQNSDNKPLKIPKDVDMVIIDDHKKGVIKKELIDKINGNLNTGCRWFIRTKDKRIRESITEKWPDWLRQIDQIELLVVGPEISCRSYPIDGLLTTHDELAEHSYELIKSLKENKKIENIILTSDKLEVVALFGETCFIARPLEAINNIDLEKVNWTTAFFAAMAYEMREVGKTCDGDMMKRAMSNAHRLSGVRLPEVLGASRRLGSEEATAGDSGKPEPKSNVVATKWAKIKEGWETAKSIDKLLSNPNSAVDKTLDMWRLSTDLPGYIMCIKEKKQAIQGIWQAINAFVQSGDSSQSVSILLEADPAAGKSFLVEKLKENIPNCQLVKRDITQMIERSELLDLFDSVADAQAKSKGPVLVFVDEINATLGGSPVYGAFLSPLEGGNYMRNGQQVELKPCIWIFAGTPEHIECNATGERSQKEKREDFESRMTMIQRIDYKSMQDERERVGERNGNVFDEEAKLEQVYLGAKRINDAFIDVSEIDIDVLKAFSLLLPKTVPARKIGKMATSLRNVQYGRVHKGNCTSLEWQELINSMPKYEQERWREKFDLSDVKYVRLKLRPD